MRQQSYDRTQVNNILTQIYEDMTVYDRRGDEVGTVDRIYFGAVDETDRGQGPAAPRDDDGISGPSLIEAVADALDPGEDLPEVLRNRLVRQGYIRIDGDGLFAADRYILPDQIDHVTADGVVLRVDRDDLIRE